MRSHWCWCVCPFGARLRQGLAFTHSRIRRTAFFYEGADGIALSHDMQWLHYCPLTSHSFYRIETKLLRDDTVSRGNV